MRSVKRCLVKIIGRAMLSYSELNTILVEIEGVINARPLTYVFDDSEGISYPLTPSQLINGRNLMQEPNHKHAEIVSTYEALSRRAKYQYQLLSKFTNRWKNEYLIGLMEAYRSKQNTNDFSISPGDVVILKNDQTKRQFWKLCKVIEVIKGADSKVRAAKVQLEGKKVFQRPLQHLIPIEIACKHESKQAANDKVEKGSLRSDADSCTPSRLRCTPRRNAAVVGELVRRDLSSSR